ncbi:hypothetical protein GCM10008915_65790 [Bifidobacterium pullorum subsp. gallinarum]
MPTHLGALWYGEQELWTGWREVCFYWKYLLYFRQDITDEEDSVVSMGYLNTEKWGENMRVKRIVANIGTKEIAAAKTFYQDVLGLDILMDHGWIATYGSQDVMTIQLSFASEGGGGTPVPDLSIEVDDIETVLKDMKGAGFRIEYGPVDEPWGVRRFFVRDPYGKLVNILAHLSHD